MQADEHCGKVEAKFDLPEQRVIKADVSRTKTGVLSESEMNQLEILLTFYCKITETPYKQGINEIFAPFLLLTRNGISLMQAFVMGKNFIEKCLLSMFKDSTFRPAQAMFCVMKLLLRYYNPSLCMFLLSQNASPELYATSWFLTVFATKIPKLQHVFYFWKAVITENDPLFVCYIAVAVLEKYQEQVKSKKFPNAAQAISRILITELEDIEEIMQSARGIKRLMPYSWRHALNGLDIFNLPTIDSVMLSLKDEYCVSVFPREIIKIIYPDSHCFCRSSCVWCEKANKIKQNVIVVDCRPEIEIQGGVLPGSQVIDPKVWHSLTNLQPFIETLGRYKGNSHIIVLGSSDIKFSGFEVLPSECPMTSNEMVQAVCCGFVSLGFPYVSVAQGGFKRCHELVETFKLEIQDHIPECCVVCDPNCMKTQAKMRFGLKKFARSVGDVIKSGVSIVKTGFGSFASDKHEEEKKTAGRMSAKAYLCRKFDKVTNERSDEEYSLIVDKTEVMFGRFANNQPLLLIKTLETIQMSDLLKITSMKKFPNVLTFITTSKQLCLILSSLKDSKECITLVTKYFRDIKS